MCLGLFCSVLYYYIKNVPVGQYLKKYTLQINIIYNNKHLNVLVLGIDILSALIGFSF